jgi:8-oxo-dGTP pyrophosphatase MutT (NUDIX family)
VSDSPKKSSASPEPTNFSRWLDTIVPAMFPTDAALARAAGLPPSSLHRWRRGGLPKVPALYQLAEATGAGMEQLLAVTGYIPPEHRRRPKHSAASAEPPVVAAIVTSRGRVLIGRRNDREPPWTFIAGEQEPGERPEDTAIREVKEETGCEIRPLQIIGERDHPQTGRHMVYLAAKPARSTKIIVGDEAELAEVRWASLKEALDLLPGMYEPVLEHLRQAIPEATGR